MTYQTKLPLGWDTERLTMTDWVPDEIPELQAIHEACVYLAKWDGEYTQSDHHLRDALKNFPAVRFWTGLGVNGIVKVHGDRVCSETTHAQVNMEMVF